MGYERHGCQRLKRKSVPSSGPCDLQVLNIHTPEGTHCNWARLEKLVYFNEATVLSNYEILSVTNRQQISVRMENIYKNEYKLKWKWTT